MKTARLIMREKRIVSGDFMEVEVYPVFESARSQSRAMKCKPSLPKQRNLNDKNAKKHLTRLINANFTDKDIHLTLTYNTKELPSTTEEAENDVRNFIRRVNTRRKKLRLPGLRYISIVEQVAEDGKPGRIHHHIVCDGDMDRDELERIWKKGRCNSSRLQPDESGLTGLAMYLTKESKRGKRWHQSKGLKQPIISVNDWKWSKRKSQDMAKVITERDFEKNYPGWHCSKAEAKLNEMLGLFSIITFMRKIE